MSHERDARSATERRAACLPGTSALWSALLLVPVCVLLVGPTCSIGPPRVQVLDDCYLSSETNVCGAIPGCDVAYDTATGLSWLSWDATDGQSVDEVMHDLVDVDFGGTGTSQEGWRYATLVEVCDFAKSGVVVNLAVDCFGDQSWKSVVTPLGTSSHTAYEHFADTVGQTNTQVFGYDQTAGITADVDAGLRVVALLEDDESEQNDKLCEGPDAGQVCNSSQDCTPDPSCWQGVCACVGQGYTFHKLAFFDPTVRIATGDGDSAIGHALVRAGNACN